MTMELKACPFCGGEAEVEAEDGIYSVVCVDCEARGPLAYRADNACVLWNRRVRDDAEV